MRRLRWFLIGAGAAVLGLAALGAVRENLSLDRPSSSIPAEKPAF